jgi:hypothetical protein
MYHIERTLKCLGAMFCNMARVEGSITKSFLLKKITYFSSVYFMREHNVNVLPCDTMSVKNLLLVTLNFFNGDAQLQAVA